MSPTPLPFAQALDQALPVEISGSGHSLLTRYRVYPVFGPAWARGRTRVWSLMAALLLILAVVPLPARNSAADFPLGGMLQLAVQLLLPILLGPWLCAGVRLQGWTPAREWWALVAVFVALVASMQAFHAWAAEPMKQWVAERVGAVDETGKRNRVQVAIGVIVSNPDLAASDAARGPMGGRAPGAGPQPDPATDPDIRATNAFGSAAMSFFLGGGMGLATWRRQRAALATLANERELQRAQAQRREAELRLSVLAAQVEPHFLFNTLAGVRSAISTDPARASVMIDRLVDYLRAAIPRLRSDGGAAATLGSQLEIVRAYLGLMHARMPRLAFGIDAPAALLDAPFPPLMLISLAENAVKHGAEPKVGLDVARAASSRCHIVFTTAHDSHAVAAFEAGAVDYLLKPLSAERLAQTVQRLQDRLAARTQAPALEPLVQQLAAQLQGAAPATRLRWVSASVGETIKLFSVDEVLFFQSDEKYTRVVTAGDEAHIRKPLKEIAEGLDPEEFWQVHRGLVVRAAAISRAQRDELGRITVHLKNHAERLAVSQAWAWRFKPM